MIEDHPRNPPQIRPQMTTAAALAHIYFFAGMHRMTLAVFTRKDFGTKAFNPHGLTAFFILLIMGGAYPVMMLYFYAWLITLLWHRYNSYRLRWKGLDGHSRYQGFPWLAMKWPGIKDERAARRAEPFLCLFAGLVLVTISEPLGLLVIGGFFSFGACMAIDALVDRQRVQAMRDAEIEMRYYAEQWRGRR